MAYTAITNAEIDQDSPITQTLMTKYRDNIILAAEGLWHPYNRAEPDGSETGIFYDFAVDGGATQIETPNFEAGYDYMVVVDGLVRSGAPYTINLEIFRDTPATYSSASLIVGTTNSGAPTYGTILLLAPMWPQLRTDAHCRMKSEAALNISDVNNGDNSNVQTCSKVRLVMSGASTAGKVALLRRKHIWPF